jgi:ABC-type transport system involved in multi-copper enzyme maturation permease subunit
VLSLLYKELLLIRRQLLLGLAFILLFIFAFQSLEEKMFIAAVMPVAYLLAMTSCACEEKNRGDILLNSLPLSRKAVVLAKYITLVLLFLVASLFYYILYLAINAAGISLRAYPITIEGLLIAFLAVAFMNSVYFPFYFKLGYIKSRMLFFVVFLAAFAGIAAISNYLAAHQGEPWVRQMLNFFAALPQPAAIVLLVGFSLLILLISYGISLYFYTRREF